MTQARTARAVVTPTARAIPVSRKRAADLTPTELEERRARDRAKYHRRRDIILERQKAYSQRPEVRERRLIYWHERYKTKYATGNAKAHRRAVQLSLYYVRHYGTPYPEAGAESQLIPGQHHHATKGRCPWEGHRSTRLAMIARAIRSRIHSLERSATQERAKSAAILARSRAERKARMARITRKATTSSSPSIGTTAKWIPVPVGTEIATPPTPTVYLCQCNTGYGTLDQAKACERNHTDA